jgi:hypothetical protein
MLDMSTLALKRQAYDLLNRQWQALIDGEHDPRWSSSTCPT